jgi:hypothetical protein
MKAKPIQKDLTKIWADNNISKDGNTIVDAEYQVIAVK